MSNPSPNAICQYYFNDLASNKIRNLKTNVYDLSLVNVGTASFPTITASSSTVSSSSTFSLFQNTASDTNYSYYVNNTNSGIRTLTGSFSISFWGYINSAVASTWGTVWCLYNDLSNNLITFTQQTTGPPIFSITLNGVRFYVGAIAFPLNTYNHLVLTCNTSGTTSTIQLYLNGSLYEFNGSNSSGNRSNVTWATNTITMTQLPFDGANTILYVLGGPSGRGIAWPAASTVNSQGFNGFISQLTIYNKALTQSEVTYLRTNIVTSYVYVAPGFNYYLRGKFDNTYAVTSQVLSAQTYSPNCVSSDGKNLISIQGTYPNFTIYYSTNYGANWALSNAPVTIYSPTCSPVNFPNVFYVGAINGSFKLYRSADGGATWTLISTQFGNISGLCVNDADTILYLSNYQNAMYYSTRAGNASFNYATNTGTFTFTQITNSNNSFQYTSCVCSPDGTFLFGTASGSNCAFKYNFNNTSSFNATLASSYNTNISGVAMSSTGSYLYASLYFGASNSLLRSTDGGATFNAIGTGVIPNNSNFGISCDTTGQYVQATTSQYWYISSNYGTTFTAYTGSLPSPPSIYNNNQFVLQLSNTNVNYITPPPYPCFLQGSKILRLNPETDEESYVPVETLREGDLIRTHRNGYKAIFHIGRKTLDRPSDDPNPRNRLYRFPKSKIPGMREDLCITGEHCTLHNDLSPELKDKVNEHMGDIYITEYMYRVPACLDERAVPYKGDGPVTIWHFALENHNIYHNYGVYANGLLVESCSIEYLVNKSKMILI